MDRAATHGAQNVVGNHNTVYFGSAGAPALAVAASSDETPLDNVSAAAHALQGFIDAVTPDCADNRARINLTATGCYYLLIPIVHRLSAAIEQLERPSTRETEATTA